MTLLDKLYSSKEFNIVFVAVLIQFFFIFFFSKAIILFMKIKRISKLIFLSKIYVYQIHYIYLFGCYIMFD